MKTALKVLNELVADGVIQDYAIGGATGAAFYVEAISTMDVDVFVLFNDDFNLLPLQPVYDALKSKGYLPDDNILECVNIAGTPVQFRPAYNPLLIDALANAEPFEYDGIPTKVITAEHLAAICVQTNRVKDRMRVEMFLAWDGFDKLLFFAILDKFGMSEKKALWMQK